MKTNDKKLGIFGFSKFDEWTEKGKFVAPVIIFQMDLLLTTVQLYLFRRKLGFGVFPQ